MNDTAEPSRPKRKKKKPVGTSVDTSHAFPQAQVSKWQWRTRVVAVALLIGIAAGGGGGFFLGKYMSRPTPRPIAGPAYVKVESWNPRKGPENAKVTIVEFSDFQCPFCVKASAIIDEVLKGYPDHVALVYRHRPLAMHKDARGAALAMQAAARQGKAWEMHDKLFTSPRDLSRAVIDGFVAELGLDEARFKADMDDPKIAAEVANDEKAADAAQAGGTPCFFINGRRIPGAQPPEAFKKVIDEELKKADELLASGTPAAELHEKLAKAQKSN